MKQTIASKIRGKTDWTETKVSALAQEPGDHPMGGGLYLKVAPPREKTWFFRYQGADKVRRRLSLGYYPAVSYAAARLASLQAKQKLHDGTDPHREREAAETARALESARATYTVRKAVEDYYDAHHHAWRDGKTKKQWKSLIFGTEDSLGLSKAMLQTPVCDVVPQTLHQEIRVLAVAKFETARKVKSRLERAFEFGRAEGKTDKDPLRDMAPLKRPAAQRPRPHPSLSHRELPGFIRALRDAPARNITRLALEWAILSGSRPIEVRRASWSQIDREARIWEIPESLMKMGDSQDSGAHKVPLTDRHLEILDAMEIHRVGGDSWIFPGQKSGQMMSENVFAPVLRALGFATTTHGFRATMKTWAIDRHRYDNRIIEAAIAHKEAALERSYNRSDYWPHRTALAEEYAGWCLRGEQPPKTRLQAAD